MCRERAYVASEPDGLCRTGHDARACSIAELSQCAVAPALHSARGARAGEIVTCGDMSGGQTQSGHFDRKASVDLRSVAHLAQVVRSPTEDGALASSRARVVPAGCDLHDSA